MDLMLSQLGSQFWGILANMVLLPEEASLLTMTNTHHVPLQPLITDINDLLIHVLFFLRLPKRATEGAALNLGSFFGDM